MVLIAKIFALVLSLIHRDLLPSMSHYCCQTLAKEHSRPSSFVDDHCDDESSDDHDGDDDDDDDDEY